MRIFDAREAAFENKFAHDAEMRFRAEARRDKLVGLWAAGLLGRHGAAAEAYAQDVVRTVCEAGGTDALCRKLSGDLGSIADEPTIRAMIAECGARAKAQLLEEAIW